MEAAPTARQRLIQATEIAFVILLVLTLWPALKEFYGLIASETTLRILTAPPSPSWHSRVVQTIAERYELVAGALFLVGTIGLLVQMGFIYRVMDFLYSESPDGAERSFTGYLVHMVALLAQLALIRLMIAAVNSGGGRLAPALLVCFLIVNGLWLFLVYLDAESGEKRPLRGVWRAALGSTLFAAGLLSFLWFWEDWFSVKELAILRAANASIVGTTLILLCAVEAYVQAHTYGAPKKVSGARYTVAAVVAAMLLGLAMYLIARALLPWKV